MPKLTAQDIEEIRKRAEEASEGNWINADGGYVLGGFDFETGGDFIADCRREVDAVFISHARTDIPKLLAEVERLRAGYNDLDRFSTDHLVYELQRRDEEMESEDDGIDQALHEHYTDMALELEGREDVVEEPESHPRCPHCRNSMFTNHIVIEGRGRVSGHSCSFCMYSEWDGGDTE